MRLASEFSLCTQSQFTNDPERDPELSGSTVDRTDPTQTSGIFRRLWHYTVFLSGFPFGFERLPGIVRHAVGLPLPETWIDHPNKQKNVQQEYIIFTLGYIAFAALALARPSTVGANLFYYWILPHMLGAGHLRYYQTAEHRACRLGNFTETNAWIVSRTTATWWVYAKLAWNMPYHSEHHAWPNVPFYLLPELHQRIKKQGSRPQSGCRPGGEHGYLHMHCTILPLHPPRFARVHIVVHPCAGAASNWMGVDACDLLVPLVASIHRGAVAAGHMGGRCGEDEMRHLCRFHECTRHDCTHHRSRDLWNLRLAPLAQVLVCGGPRTAATTSLLLLLPLLPRTGRLRRFCFFSAFMVSNMPLRAPRTKLCKQNLPTTVSIAFLELSCSLLRAKP